MYQTQLQILTAVVKLFLKRPDKAQGLVQRVLQAATAENDNPDVRDRAYIYWRLLSNTSDQDATKSIVLSDKPPIVTTISSLPPALLDRLLQELSTLSSVYHKPPEQFVGQGRFGADAVQRAAIEYVCIVPSEVYTITNSTTGSKSKTPVKTPWPRQLPPPQSAAPHPLHRHKTTSRTCWTSISTAVPLRPRQRSPLDKCPASRDWPVPQSACSLPQVVPLHPKGTTTWMTFSAYLATLVPRSHHQAALLTAVAAVPPIS